MRIGEDKTVEMREGIIIGEKDVYSILTPSFGLVVESRIRMSENNHAAGAVGDAVAAVGGDIIKEFIGCSVGDLGGSILLAAKGAEDNK